MSELDKQVMEMGFNITKPGRKFSVDLDNGKTATFYVSITKGVKYCHLLTKRGTIMMLEKPLRTRVDFGY